MALSGIILFAFVVVHMIGNLKIYQGPDKYDAYAHFLRTVGAPVLGENEALWIFRIVMLAAVGLHVLAAAQLTLQSWRARGTPYQVKKDLSFDYASRTMRWGGVIILLYVLFHLADLTFGWANPDFHPGKPYENLVISLTSPLVSSLYVVANVALGLHLYHGLWSLFQSLGWNSQRWNPWRRRFATLFAWVITLGNVSFPIAVLTGWVS
jgi:succinate dehydrogenase / fumarate reductase cytochrome b subunit